MIVNFVNICAMSLITWSIGILECCAKELSFFHRWHAKWSRKDLSLFLSTISWIGQSTRSANNDGGETWWYTRVRSECNDVLDDGLPWPFTERADSASLPSGECTAHRAYSTYCFPVCLKLCCAYSSLLETRNLTNIQIEYGIWNITVPLIYIYMAIWDSL